MKVFVEASEPHSLLCLAAYIRERGFRDIRVLDAYAMELSHDDVIADIAEYNPDVIGMTCYTSDAPLTIDLCKRIKKKFPGKSNYCIPNNKKIKINLPILLSFDNSTYSDV